MSTRYKHGDRVPNSVLADRLDELADAVVARMKGDTAPMDREFTCRIPAEMDRDPDLVLSAAAKRLREFEECFATDKPAQESSRSPGCLNVPSELDVAEDKIQELETLITVLRADIRELYSMRGEDELTAKYCNAILTATADI